MASVQLRDIVTEDDVEAVMGLRRGPGQDQDQFIGTMISYFEDAICRGARPPAEVGRV